MFRSFLLLLQVRLIARAVAAIRRSNSPPLRDNCHYREPQAGYIAEELLAPSGQWKVNRRRFFRSVTLPPGMPSTDTGRLADEAGFPGDVVITRVNGSEENHFDVVDDHKEGDIVLKRAIL